MLPCLPAADTAPDARRRELDQSREDYRFDHSLAGLPLAAEVPRGEGYSPEYMLRAAKVELDLVENRRAASKDPRLDEDRARYRALVDSARGGIAGALDDLRAELADVKARGLYRAPLVMPDHLDDYAALFQSLPLPASRPFADDDAFFAWQRLGGCNPAQLRGLAELDPRLGVDEASFRRAIPDGDDSLARSLEEGRLFLLDRSFLAGAPTRPSHGFSRYVDGPLALFVRTLAGPLAPVLVQMGPTPGSAVVGPRDGERWRLAKLAVQSADAASQGVIEHLGRCHIFASAVYLTTARELAPRHPLRTLLAPHFEMTLAANATMRTAVIGPDGFVDQLQGPSLDAALALAGDALRRGSVRDSSPLRDLDVRRVSDTTALPDYPYRDDARLVAAALGRWVHAYLALYYDGDAALAADGELSAWVRALSAADSAGLADVPSISTVAERGDLVTTIVFRVTALHAVINYGGYDYYAWPPTLPTARWAPMPAADGPVPVDAYRASLPPLGLADLTLDLMLPQRELRLNTLGAYPRGHFVDPRVAPLEKALRDELADAERVISARDAARRWSSPSLLPSRIAQSIHV